MAKHPSQLADLEIQRRLGAGGMAEVFLAKKRGAEGTYKLLVVKRILPAHGSSRRFRAMFVEEAHLATRLNHPNIVQVYEFSDHGEDGLLLSMEYVEGFDLGKLMRAAQQKESRIPPLVSAFIVSEAAKGLHYAHERKDEGGMPLAIVHRDVSPQNILISFEGVVKIADFGIASANLFREEPGVLKGKFGYMSPEQARGERVDRRSDIYALGVVLYELLAMRSPYGKLDDDALLQAVKEGLFEPPSAHAPDIPTELEAIVMRAMAGDPEDRFQTARDLAGAIARVLLAKQELVDNASVEQTVAHLLGREREQEARAHAEGGAKQEEQGESSVAQPQTLAAVPAARTGGDVEGTGAPRVVREVRHVAVVTLRIEGVDALLGAQGRLAGKRSGRSIRTTLDAIAFKHGAIWSWESHASARAVVGLLANPSRAAADAASLAVDVHEALAGASEDLPVELRAAIGIVRGIAYGERDEQGHLINHVLKEPANYLAERLGSRTPFGKTWVAGGVYRLVRRDFRWGDAPSLDLDDARGYPVPHQMRLYALQRPLTREERMAEIALSPNDLVGRDAERADLHAAYHRAVSPPVKAVVEPAQPAQPAPRFGEGEPPQSMPGKPESPPGGALRGQSVARVIVGEMGIGKSALISTFLSELPGEARVLHVECSPVKSELPLATVCDVLRDVTGMGLDHAIDDAAHVIRALLGPIARSPLGSRIVTRLAELVTGKQVEHPEDDAAAYGRDIVARGVKYLLGSLARHQPLVVVIDGLQWADRPSLELISELLKQRSERLPILVLLLTRPEERVTPFIEGLVRIELRGLSAEEQMRLVEARLGVRDGVAAVCGELVPRVAGNPFFLLEMVDALLERGTLEIVEHPGGRHELVRHDRTGDRGEPLPSTLEQLIGDRLRELPPAEHDVVNWLAVAGGPLLKDDILNLTRLADDEAVTRLCARGLCDRRAGAVDFRHPLVRDVAYLALDSASRVRMHRRLGEHLSTTPLAQGLSAAIVAQHLARGEAPGPAAELYLDAARAARAGHQAQLSRRYYERALSLLPTGDSRRMIAHEALEAIFRHLGRRRERRKHLAALRQLAKESGQARWAALALVRTARLDLDEGHLARGLPVAQRAAEIARIARRPALEVEALTILSEVLRELGDVQGAISAADRALRVTHTGGLTPRARAEVLRAKGVLLRRVGRVQEAVEAYAEAIAVFRAVGARRSEARAKNSLAVAMFVLERFEDAIAVGLSSISIDLAIGGRFQIAKTLSNIGHAYAKLGDMPRSLAYMKRAREAHERYDDQDARADTLLCSAGILLEAGDVDAAHALCADASALIAVTGSVYDMIHERNVRGLLARARGDIQGAIANASEARQLAESQGLMSYHAYATAIEAASRVDAGEVHTGVLLARTALGAVEASSSEYGIEVRDLCCAALQKGAPASAADAYHRAAAHVRMVAGYIRDARLKALFLERTVVRRILAAEAEGPAAGHDPLRRGEMA
ncbi:serine/threonine-protein kinase [Sorangium sp. So ce1335]|uniref:serine/threonine-protein kinase n=1 Tax=Sorangium sp. So ce1335 TaxID=3133335 RepID=UPI003F622F60